MPPHPFWTSPTLTNKQYILPIDFNETAEAINFRQKVLDGTTALGATSPVTETPYSTSAKPMWLGAPYGFGGATSSYSIIAALRRGLGLDGDVSGNPVYSLSGKLAGKYFDVSASKRFATSSQLFQAVLGKDTWTTSSDRLLHMASSPLGIRYRYSMLQDLKEIRDVLNVLDTPTYESLVGFDTFRSGGIGDGEDDVARWADAYSSMLAATYSVPAEFSVNFGSAELAEISETEVGLPFRAFSQRKFYTYPTGSISTAYTTPIPLVTTAKHHIDPPGVIRRNVSGFTSPTPSAIAAIFDSTFSDPPTVGNVTSSGNTGWSESLAVNTSTGGTFVKTITSVIPHIHLDKRTLVRFNFTDESTQRNPAGNQYSDVMQTDIIPVSVHLGLLLALTLNFPDLVP